MVGARPWSTAAGDEDTRKRGEDGGDRRPYELDALASERLGKSSVLAEVPVPWVDAVSAADLDGHQHVGQVQVAVAVGRLTDADRPVRQMHVPAVAIYLRVDCDSLDAEPVTGSYHTACDFAAVRDQDRLEH